MTAADHALLTRFNLAGPDEWGARVNLDPGWLEQRLQLFGRYCAPSVLAQTSGDFVWIVFIDPASPDWLADRIRVAAPGVELATASRFHGTEDFRRAVHAQFGDGLWLTSRVDSDDALARDFIARARRHATDGWVAFPDGAVLNAAEGRASAFRYEENAFLTRLAQSATAIDENHVLVRPRRLVEGSPAWLIVVHGANVSNQFGDTRPRSSAWTRAHFELSDAPLTDALTRRHMKAVARRMAPTWRADRARKLSRSRPRS